MKYFSMFSGIGGFEYGIKKATNNKKNNSNINIFNGSRRPYSYDCVGFSEIDKYAVQIYEKHFPTHKNYGNARNIDTNELPDFDMLCGGFPCQSFSIAGKRKGFQDTRGTLFHEICRIVESKRPRLLFLENVKGLLSADNGRCFATIITSLDELGYNVEWQVLNSKNFGVPQNRERVFIIGHLRGESKGQIFPLGETNNKIKESNRGTRQEIKIIDDVGRINKGKKGDRMKEDGNCFTLNTIEQRGIMTKIIHPTLTSELAHSTGRDFFRNGGIKLARAIDVYNHSISDIVPTLKDPCHNDRRLLINEKMRRLTPIECERLQGFPDNWTEGISDTQRYKCLGNAVTTNVIEAIAERLI